MVKRKHNHSEQDDALESGALSDEQNETRLGLTEAFAPITDPQIAYDEGDVPLGLTQAFGPVNASDNQDEGSWDADGGKWNGFNWSAPVEGAENEDGFAEDESDFADEDAPAPAHAVAAAAVAAPAAAAAALASSPAGQNQPASAQTPASTDAKKGSHAAQGKHGKHGKVVELSPQMQQSRRLRRTLVIVIVLVVVLAAAAGVFAFHWIQTSQNQAVQQASKGESQTSSISETTGKDASEKAVKTTKVPNISTLLGLSLEDAMAQVGQGITVATSTAVDEEGNPIKTQVSAPLTDEPADSKTGTPTMYFGLDEGGAIIQVGYSTSTASLGFSTTSFRDAIENEHVIENAFSYAGVTIPSGSVVLSSDKTTYSSYASDGTTLVRERCSFSGPVTVSGNECTWSAVLSYDYTTANLTGNLADTVRIIYIYLTD